MTQRVLANGQIACMTSGGVDYGLVERGAVAIEGPTVRWVGTERELPDALASWTRIDLDGRLVTPALIDCHTHLIYGGDRAAEFELRLRGASYEEIARAGGGIASTVAATRSCSEDELVTQALPRVDALMAEGVATIEVKSGYGLTVKDELKMLRAARRLGKERAVRVTTSWLAAHAVPKPYLGRSGAYLDDVVIPGLHRATSEGLVDAVDGFCESIAFSVAEIERLFETATALGLPVKLHAEQLTNLGGAKLAARYGALSADHLEYLEGDGVQAMADAGTVAVLLPGAFYTLRETRLPPVALLREARVPLAIASDCNPGSSPLFSPLLTMNLACTLFRLTPEEALAGMTRVAARALGMADEVGTIEVGKRAELAIWNVSHPAELAYRIGFCPLHGRIADAPFDTSEGFRALQTAGTLNLEQLGQLWTGEARLAVDRGTQAVVERSAAAVARAAAGEHAVYGVNTGFGKLANVKIPAEHTVRLQKNLVLSHCSGVGEPLPAQIVRLIIALKALSLARGASGVRWKVIEQLEALYCAGVIPLIPAQGSVGASGDLAPLAHLAAVMIGDGEAFFEGQRLPGSEVLHGAGLAPIALQPKEGLALINGTQVSTALALEGLFRAWRAMRTALVTGALAADAAMASDTPFRAEIHRLRGQPGQIEAARALRSLMIGSEIRTSHRQGDERVQDPYCIRCYPQVAGACLELLRQAGSTLRIEANAVTDNPLVMVDGRIASGGNFHAEPVAFAADQIALAIAEIGAITQRRIALLVDPALSFGLPAFLSPEPGLNSGFMVAEVVSAALMSENRQRAAPASVDSTPTSANQEDHVSMACHAARRLLDMSANLERIVGIEALVAAQGIELRRPLATSVRLQRAIEALRTKVPSLVEDRFLAHDLEAAAELVRSGRLVDAAGVKDLPTLTPLFSTP